MSLTSLVDNSRTDKNTNHSYLPVYEKLFQEYRDTKRIILEIGIAQGGSIKLWSDYFYNACIYGIDIYSSSELPPDLLKLKNVYLFTNTNAYSPEFIKELPPFMDIVIDDGPHTLDSQKQAIQLYLPLINPNGLLVIEDIQEYSHIQELIDCIPRTIRCTYEIHDLRGNKGRADDLLLIIKKL